MSGAITSKPVKISSELQNNYNKLFQDGILVNVHISIWGMGARLSKEDLGVEVALPKLFKLGKKMLIEPERLNEFKNLEGKSRRYLYRNSYDFPIVNAHFVPKRLYAEVMTNLHKFRQEFDELVNTFVTNYETYKDEVLNKYPDIAEVLRPLYPPVEVIRDKFGFNTASFELSMPREFSVVTGKNSQVAQEQLKAQEDDAMLQLTKFAADAVAALRGNLVKMCKTVMQKIDDKDLLSKANLSNIRDEITNFRALNFLNDDIVNVEINNLEVLLNSGQNFKSNEEAVASLKTSINSLLTRASTLSDVPALCGKYFKPAAQKSNAT